MNELPVSSPMYQGGRAMTTVRDQDQSTERGWKNQLLPLKIYGKGAVRSHCWELTVSLERRGTKLECSQQQMQAKAFLSPVKQTAIHFPQEREMSISSCSLQEKAAQGRNSIFSSAWKWTAVYMNRAAKPAVCVRACLSSTRKLNNCWYNCFKVQLLKRPQHNDSVFSPEFLSCFNFYQN